MGLSDTLNNTIDVVAAVIERGGRYLLCRRAPEKAHGGLWEFPGGKVQPGENFAEALARELDEELSLTTTKAGKLLYSGRETDSPFVIHFVPVTVSGSPQLHEHTDARWATIPELEKFELAPTDRAFVDYLSRRT
jgi:8-oxo-dGTP diphosphatase